VLPKDGAYIHSVYKYKRGEFSGKSSGTELDAFFVEAIAFFWWTWCMWRCEVGVGISVDTL